ncbi:sulfite exporter TauE/SafE family protein [Streptosporangium subroseum]|uniref:sulfite exporter TauE/SafE family protein n=1 Tax=Streptosporangium subroseum TaxID=106412 RepID=UPI0030865913|nr:sulfite exporter TauE/SafE family protein [Streptosporangium subroseum]
MNDEVFTFILVGLSVFVGAIAQGAIGFGMGLVAAPVITMLNPSVMPGAIQVVNFMLPLFTLAAEWRRVDWRGLGFAVLGRIPGSFLGGLVVVYVSTRTLGVLVGTMVLIAVGLTAWAVAVPRNGWTLTGAGFVSGITGTATGIGGPPMGLVYQNAKGSDQGHARDVLPPQRGPVAGHSRASRQAPRAGADIRGAADPVSCRGFSGVRAVAALSGRRAGQRRDSRAGRGIRSVVDRRERLGLRVRFWIVTGHNKLYLQGVWCSRPTAEYVAANNIQRNGEPRPGAPSP